MNNSKNIVLIEPPTGEKKITSFRYPPMGLLALATFLIKEGYNVSLIDACIDNLSIEEIIKRVRATNTRIVGISSMSVNIIHAFRIAEALKENDQKIRVITGGIHPTVMPQHTLSNKNIDIVVMGEGEITTSVLLRALQNNEDISAIEGVAFRKGDEIVLNRRRPLINGLDSLPIPIYPLLDIKKYKSPYAKKAPFVSIVRSRGCPFDCTFCGNPQMFGRTFRCQSPERTIKEIDYLVKELNIREISFKDTELTLDRNLEKLCDLLIEKHYDLIWSCNGRVSNINENLLKKMKQAGCYSITFGIESGNEGIIKHIKKQITLDQARFAVKAAKKAGLQIVANFMIGNPFDTKETIEQTISFAKELDTDYAYFGFATPFPGTELRKQAELNNWILDASMDAIRYDDCMMNATSLATEELRLYLDKAYKSFYFRPKYLFHRLLHSDFKDFVNYFYGFKAIMANTLKVKKSK